MDERDLRSLDRPGLYKAFRPLDPNERLPRELLFEHREGLTWGLRMGRQHVAGALWLPVYLLTLGLVVATMHSLVLALIAAAVLFAGFWAWAFTSLFRSP